LDALARAAAALGGNRPCSLEFVVLAALSDFLIAQTLSREFAAHSATSESENTRVVDVLLIGGVSWKTSKLLND
jgi:hypothetical protein